MREERRLRGAGQDAAAGGGAQFLALDSHHGRGGAFKNFSGVRVGEDEILKALLPRHAQHRHGGRVIERLGGQFLRNVPQAGACHDGDAVGALL